MTSLECRTALALERGLYPPHTILATTLFCPSTPIPYTTPLPYYWTIPHYLTAANYAMAKSKSPATIEIIILLHCSTVLSLVKGQFTIDSATYVCSSIPFIYELASYKPVSTIQPLSQSVTLEQLHNFKY